MSPSTTADPRLDRGRAAFQQQAWSDAYAQLQAADQAAALDPDDLERLATAAFLIGKDADFATFQARAYNQLLAQGEVDRAARCAFWLGFGLIIRGEQARGGGWLARAQRLLDNGDRSSVVQGYLLLPEARRQVMEGDAAAGYSDFDQATRIGDRFHDPDLLSLGRLGRGRALIRLGETREGVGQLDEAMVAVTAGEVSPLAVGLIYCAVIDACQEIYDLRRAREWTAALAHWCDSQPDVVPYRGQCMVHRAEIMQFNGAWPNALDEARRAGERLSQPPGEPAAGSAFYQQGELHRLRGEFAMADETYRQASRWGRRPQPGLALLRLAQGQVEAAAAAIRRALDETTQRRTRARMLTAYVEIMLAAGDIAAARAGCVELSEIARTLDAPVLRATAAQAEGAVLLAEGDAKAAAHALRLAGACWRDLDAPYEAARGRVLMGLACRELGDEDTAQLELDAARRVFQMLRAGPDLARVEELSRGPASKTAGGLTPREIQVLALVATGKTNRAIAHDLAISEKTVARHLSNIFTKLGLSTRAAATAYAYRNNLV